MDRRRAASPSFSRQGSIDSSGSSSPGAASLSSSPARHLSLSGARRAQNLAAKAANARLAKVMASHAADDEDDDDDNELVLFGAVPRHGGPASRPLAGGNGGVGVFGRAGRSPSPMLGRNVVESAASNRSTSAGRQTPLVRGTLIVPPIKPTLRTPSPVPTIEQVVDRKRERRNFLDMGMGQLSHRESGNFREASALQDQLDVLEEENSSLLEKLQLAEERWKEAEARSRELEKQVANFGEGISLEARLLSRKEAALKQKEEAMRAALRNKDEKGEEVAVLQQQLQSAKDEIAAAAEQLKEAESEALALKSRTQRMILTQEEMEEVVLKRCWLARYWGLAVQHGIYPEISARKYEHWSSFAPLPLEVVTSAGQKAKNESWSSGYDNSERTSKLARGLNDITGEGNIESMLAVEKGLRELASLKVEDAVVLGMAQHRRPNLLRQLAGDYKSPSDPKFVEAFDLSEDESQDVLFKQAWLIYFWRRAKTHGVEEDIAEERLQYWISHFGKAPTSHDAIGVERGLVELRKLSIEQQLWEASRREIDGNRKLPIDDENS